MRFLDPKKPISTCNRENCKKCGVEDTLYCHFSKKQLYIFWGAAFPVIIMGALGALLFEWRALVIYIVAVFSYFGLIEIRVMCSHCPHYAEPGEAFLRCWANYGSPKVWKYRPGPMSFWEKTVFLIGMAAVALSPGFFLFFSGRYSFLLFYLTYISIGFYALLTHLCTHCMNFACPFNRVKNDVREKFFEHNPVVKDAWCGPSDGNEEDT